MGDGRRGSMVASPNFVVPLKPSPVVVYPINVIQDQLGKIALPEVQKSKLSRLVLQCEDANTDSMYYRMEALRFCFLSRANDTYHGNLTLAHMECFVRDLLKDPDESKALQALQSLFRKMDSGLSLSDLEKLFKAYDYESSHRKQRAIDYKTFDDNYHGVESLRTLIEASPASGIISTRVDHLLSAQGQRRNPICVPDQVEDLVGDRKLRDLTQSLMSLATFLKKEKSISDLSLEEIARALHGSHYTGFIEDQRLTIRMAQVLREMMVISKDSLESNRKNFLRKVDEMWKERTAGPLRLDPDSEILPFLESSDFLRSSKVFSSLVEIVGGIRLRVISDEKFEDEKKKYPDLPEDCSLAFYDRRQRTIFLRDYSRDLDVSLGSDPLIQRIDAVMHELEHVRHFSKKTKYLKTRHHILVSEGQSRAVEGLWRYFHHSSADLQLAHRLGLSVGALWCLDL
ncbi:MAG: hypothetical protein IPJ69_08375 [Deltaproteobacteria bacterium]|nr:MAG: hypothetical protein IPJ69_08375 [Deltaproteobacteria bacterium]